MIISEFTENDCMEEFMNARTVTNNIGNGEIANSLHILTKDMKAFHPEEFFKYSPYGRTEIAKQAGVSRTNFYKDTVLLSTTKKLRIGILQVVMGLDLSIELFNENEKEAVQWFNSPNTMLSGESPFEVCLRGDGEGILNWLKGRLGYPDVNPF